jgi:hypothetical protein
MGFDDRGLVTRINPSLRVFCPGDFGHNLVGRLGRGEGQEFHPPEPFEVMAMNGRNGAKLRNQPTTPLVTTGSESGRSGT